MDQIPKKTATPMIEPEVVDLLVGYGIPYPRHKLVKNLEQALKAADEIGYPVVLKAVSADILHKSEVGGVVTGIKGKGALRKSYSALRASIRTHAPKAQMLGTLVCQHAQDAVEVIVGIKKDSVFGPVLLLGLGGIFIEVLDDIALRIAPIQKVDAIEMIHDIRAYPLLAGTRGQSAIDEAALVELLLSISDLAVDHPEIYELDLNPVRLYSQGLLVLDARALRFSNHQIGKY